VAAAIEEPPVTGRAEPAARELLNAAKTRLRDVIELAAAEARLAALSGLAMLILVIIAAAALVVAWLLLVLSILYLLALAGVEWWVAALLLAGAHAGLAYYLWQVAVRLSRNLTLPELRTSLVRSPAPVPEARG
jgi:hypothetical protein